MRSCLFETSENSCLGSHKYSIRTTLLKKVLIAIVVAGTVIWGLWVAFPVTAMESIAEDSLQNQDITLQIDGLRKGLFYRLQADRIALMNREAELISLHAVCVTINPLHLIALRMTFSVHGSFGEGSFSGEGRLSKKSTTINIHFQEAQLKDMQFLTLAGIRGRGTVSGRLTMGDKRGHMDFLVNDAEFEPAVFSGVLAPLNFFNMVRGSVDFLGSAIDIASVSLEGPNIFARVKGVIKNNMMDLRMEVMPQKTFLENPFFLRQVERYKISPGYYMIPVKGPVVF